MSYTIPDLTGYYVCERYQLVELIRAGNYGAVYCAADATTPSSSAGRDRRTDRAIKVIPKDDETFNILEISLHRRVSHHPHVVTLDDAFESEDYYFLVLDLHPSDLLTQIWSRGAYDHDDERVRATFLQIVDAVEACHAADVYHHDLKPGNILCNMDGSKAYLCDFGMASDRPINDEFGSGTLIYMSPECLGEDIGHRPYSNVHHDVWALGIILFNMLTGSQPWTKATTADEEFCDYLHTPTFFLDNFDISEGANELLRKILVLNPMGRAGLAELRAAVASLPSFFRARDSSDNKADQPEQTDDVAPAPFTIGELEEESLFNDDSDPVWPVVEAFDALAAVSIEQSAELDLDVVDAVVRAFLSGGSDPHASTTHSKAITADLEDNSDFDDSDSDGPITPGPGTEERTSSPPQPSKGNSRSIRPPLTLSGPFDETGRLSNAVC
ncbi:kinase-like domain-containing protein [Trametes meyenii]|nr:kinase-like domain-containing protein [Trametes meyenii]